jgi:hypothetical protein
MKLKAKIRRADRIYSKLAIAHFGQEFTMAEYVALACSFAAPIAKADQPKIQEGLKIMQEVLGAMLAEMATEGRIEELLNVAAVLKKASAWQTNFKPVDRTRYLLLRELLKSPGGLLSVTCEQFNQANGANPGEPLEKSTDVLRHKATELGIQFKPHPQRSPRQSRQRFLDRLTEQYSRSRLGKGELQSGHAKSKARKRAG